MHVQAVENCFGIVVFVGLVNLDSDVSDGSVVGVMCVDLGWFVDGEMV